MKRGAPRASAMWCVKGRKRRLGGRRRLFDDNSWSVSSVPSVQAKRTGRRAATGGPKAAGASPLRARRASPATSANLQLSAGGDVLARATISDCLVHVHTVLTVLPVARAIDLFDFCACAVVRRLSPPLAPHPAATPTRSQWHVSAPAVPQVQLDHRESC